MKKRIAQILVFCLVMIPGIVKAQISGVSSLCRLTTATFTDPRPGGIWSSSNTGRASVGSGTGIVTGLGAGTAIISYTASGTTDVATIRVLPIPIDISGTNSVCNGLTTTLTEGTPGGTWTSSNTGVATIGTGTGLVTGTGLGTSLISYTISNGCATTTIVLVSPVPAAITGAGTFCAGTTITLADATPGGYWSTSAATVSVGSGTGIVTGIMGGPANISYGFSAGCKSTVSFTVTPSVPNGVISTFAGLSGCQGLNFDRNGNLYVANGNLYKIDTNGTRTTIAGGGAGSDGGPATAASIGAFDVVADASGNLYVCDQTHNTIRKINSSGIISTIAGDGTRGFAGDGGPATNGRMDTPYGIAIDASGNLFVSDWGNRRIRKISNSGIISTIAGVGTNAFSGDGGPATAAEISFPWGLTFDTAGNLFFSDNFNYRIRKISTAGIISTVAGNGYGGWGEAAYDGSAATAVTMFNPSGLAFDNQGNLYVSIYENDLIRKISPDGIITTVGGLLISGISYNPGYSGDGGPATAAQIHKPKGLAVDAKNNIFFSDYDNAVIRKINALFYPITGGSFTRVGATIPLSEASPGGNWTSSNTAVATVGTTGIVTGVGAGTTIISYSVPGACSPAVASSLVVVLPAAITGASTVCTGATTTLTDGVSGGTWTSSNTSVANIGSLTGVVTGVSAGTAIISYNATGITDVFTITVLSAPVAISGTLSVCLGSTRTLTDATSGGTWTSTNTSVADIGSGTGLVTSVSAGTSIISYTISSGCAKTVTFLVSPTPGAITGGAALCAGSTLTLSNTATGGIWASSTTSAATIGSLTGVVTGINGGYTTISYTLSPGCIVTTSLYVSPTTGFGIINTIASYTGGLCFDKLGNLYIANGVLRKMDTSGVITTIAGGGSGGDGPATDASLDARDVTADASGNLYVTDFINNKVRKVNTSGIISTIAGSGSGTYGGDGGAATNAGFSRPDGIALDKNNNVYFTDLSGRIRKVNNSGIISTYAGNGSIGYSGDGGAATSAKISFAYGLVFDKMGNLYIADHFNYVVRKVDTFGIISTYAGNGTNRFFSLGDGGPATAGVINEPTGLAIDDSGNLYIGDYDNNLFKMVNTSGIITTVVGQIISGHAGLSGYTGDGGPATAALVYGPDDIAVDSKGNLFITDRNNFIRKVTAPFYPITGAVTLCEGANTTLSDLSPGGTWSSTNTSVATVGSTGVVTGVSGGTATISYVVSGACTSSVATKIITINSLPVAGSLSGASSVYVGSSTTLAYTSTGGIWTSSNTAIATIGSLTGIVTGVTAGTTLITYSLTNGCGTTRSTSVFGVMNYTIGSINGPASVCTGANVTLSDTSAGGIWSSSNPAVATIGSSTGIVTGVSFGTTIITYNVALLGYTTRVFTVNSTLGANSGPSSVCVGQNITLTNTISGGVWSSATTTIATVGPATGIVTGIAGGLVATINYTLSGGCTATSTVAVNSLGIISGSSSVCAGQTITLTNTTSGGVWTSSATGVATVGTGSGIVTGVASGTATISYTLASGCIATMAVAVNSLSPISGPTSVCQGQNITLTNTGSGTWSSAVPTIASIGATSGIVTGIAAGLSTHITYTLSSGCRATTVVAVNALPAISGSGFVCVGQTTTLTNTGSGAWSSSATGIAAIGSATGIVSGITSGTAIISYTLVSGCIATMPISVGGLSAISGPTSVCFGQTITLSNATAGGTWTSSAPTIASIGASTGIVTGNAGNLTATISYSLGSGCRATMVVTVYPLQPITGVSSVCNGSSATLSDATAGGVWSSSNTGIATIGSSTGLVSGLSAGTTILSYSLASGCVAQANFVVNPVSPITGPASVCKFATITLANAIAGGTWTSNAPTIASVVGATGVVTGNAAYLTATISYTLSTGCRATAIVSVNPLPTVANITGPSTVSVSGSTITLSDATAGGTWTSSNTGLATIGTGTGVVTGISAGVVIMSYTVANSFGCTAFDYKNITVGPAPAPWSGTPDRFITLNEGASIALTEEKQGGNWACINGCENVMLNTETGHITGTSAGRAMIEYIFTDGISTSRAVTGILINAIAASVTTMGNDLQIAIVPNPNKGEFTLKGNLKGEVNQAFNISITDVIGQVVYKGTLSPINGQINEQIQLANNPAPGIYLLSIYSEGSSRVLHLVIE